MYAYVQAPFWARLGSAQFAAAMSTPFFALLLPGVNGKIYASKEADPGLQDVFGNFRSMMLERGAEQMYNVECAPNSSRRGLPPNSSRRALPPPLELT